MKSARITQAVCLTLAAALVAIASGHLNSINEQRRELKIGFHEDIHENLPPKTAFLLTSLGSFRGLAIDYFWIKATLLKQEGKHYQSLQLARWICDLMPRFSDVWLFQAWEMAYNLSVSTDTPEERWKWVRDGIELLRDRGIPLNRTSLPLYKELAWIYFHKMGDRLDDMHWAYKAEWAAVMQRVVGAPTPGETTEETLAAFRKIADAPKTLDALVAEDERVGDYVAALEAAGIEVGYPLLDAFHSESAPSRAELPDLTLGGEPARAEAPATAALPDDGASGEVRDKLVAFARANILRDEYKLDTDWMMQIMEKFGPLDWRATFSHAIYWSTYGDHVVREFHQLSDIDTLNNDRIIMFGLGNLMLSGRITFELNPEHPNQSYYNAGPDIRFFEPLHQLYIELGQRESGGEGLDPLRKKQSYYFRVGHAGFIEDAIVLFYQYGSDTQLAQARKYYKYLRDNFKEPNGATKKRYLVPLDDFVLGDIRESGDRVKVAAAAMQANLLQSFEALAVGDLARHAGTRNTAQKIYSGYMKGTRDDHTTRRKLPPFEDITADALAAFMNLPRTYLSSARSPRATADSSDVAAQMRKLQAQHAVRMKARLWQALSAEGDDPDANTANLKLRQAAYDRCLPGVTAECADAGFDVAKAMPEPRDMDEYREKHPEAREAMKVRAAPQKKPK